MIRCLCAIKGSWVHQLIRCLCVVKGSWVHQMIRCLCAIKGSWVHQLIRCLCVVKGSWVHQMIRCLCAIKASWVHQMIRWLCAIKGSWVHQMIRCLCAIKGSWVHQMIRCLCAIKGSWVHQMIQTRTMMLIRMIDFTWLIDLNGDEVKIKFMKWPWKVWKSPWKNPEKSYWDNAGHPVTTTATVELTSPSQCMSSQLKLPNRELTQPQEYDYDYVNVMQTQHYFTGIPFKSYRNPFYITVKQQITVIAI